MSDLSSPVAALPARACAHPTRTVFLLALLAVFAPFSTDMYLSGFPAIARSLHTGIGQVQQSLSTFFFGMALGQLLYGPLIDRLGRRGPLLFGVAVFTLTSWLLMVVPDVGLFVGLRFVQAAGGCAGMIISRAVIQDLFSGQEAARALSLMMVVQGVGPVLAPVCGGQILAHAGWQTIFLFLGALGAVSLLAVVAFLPETLPRAARQQGAGPSLTGVFLALLTRRRFMVPMLAGSCGHAALFAYISGSPFVFITLLGLDQQRYSWLFFGNAVGMTLASQLNRVLLRHWSARTLLGAFLAVQAGAALCLALLVPTGSLLWLSLPLFVCVATVPALTANSVALAMAAGRAHAGKASSLVGVVQFGSAGLVSALVGWLHNGTAWPMVGGMTVCALAGLVLWFGGRGPAQPASVCAG